MAEKNEKIIVNEIATFAYTYKTKSDFDEDYTYNLRTKNIKELIVSFRVPGALVESGGRAYKDINGNYHVLNDQRRKKYVLRFAEGHSKRDEFEIKVISGRGGDIDIFSRAFRMLKVVFLGGL